MRIYVHITIFYHENPLKGRATLSLCSQEVKDVDPINIKQQRNSHNALEFSGMLQNNSGHYIMSARKFTVAVFDEQFQFMFEFTPYEEDNNFHDTWKSIHAIAVDEFDKIYIQKRYRDNSIVMHSADGQYKQTISKTQRSFRLNYHENRLIVFYNEQIPEQKQKLLISNPIHDYC